MKTLKLFSHTTLYVLIVLTLAAIGFGVYRSQGNVVKAQATPEGPRAAQPGRLVSLRPSIDLGTVPMKAGTVSFRYLLKNSGEAPLTINRISTSCMCTTATLVTAKGRKGPFGMPGHGPNATKALLEPAELAELEVVFDPAAHGPSGLGRIERAVTLESAEAPPLELRMVAMVTP